MVGAILVKQMSTYLRPRCLRFRCSPPRPREFAFDCQHDSTINNMLTLPYPAILNHRNTTTYRSVYYQSYWNPSHKPPTKRAQHRIDRLSISILIRCSRQKLYNKMSHLRSTTPSRDTSNTGGNENNPLLSSSGGLVSELEQEVLDEYARLLENVNKVHPPTLFSQQRTRLLTLSVDIARRRPRQPRRQSRFSDTRWPAPPRTQDGDCVHAAESECL